MMPVSNFILSKSQLNPIRNGVETVIHHSVNPRYLSYVLQVDIKSLFPMVIEMGLNIGFSYKYKGEVKVCFLVIKENIDKTSADILSLILYQQVQFYVNYLIENQKIDMQSGWTLFKDYNCLTPGLKIIEFRPQRTFIVSHNHGVSCFMDKTDLFDFLINGLMYSEELIDEGAYNIIEQHYPEYA